MHGVMGLYLTYYGFEIINTDHQLNLSTHTNKWPTNAIFNSN
jgi:hypothetical protein